MINTSTVAHQGRWGVHSITATELANIHEARTEAVSVARELCHLWDDLPPGALNKMAIEVADETGQTLLSVSFPVATGQVD